MYVSSVYIWFAQVNQSLCLVVSLCPFHASSSYFFHIHEIFIGYQRQCAGAPRDWAFHQCSAIANLICTVGPIEKGQCDIRFVTNCVTLDGTFVSQLTQ